MTDQEKLKAELTYDPTTGAFVRRTNGGIAGSLHVTGYIVVRVRSLKDDFQFKAHRLAWLYMTGNWPLNTIDHINGNRSDNSWENLRDVSNSINLQNQKRARKDNRCGFLGVRQNPYSFEARINISGKTISLGSFPNAEQAHEAYIDAKRRFHTGNTL